MNKLILTTMIYFTDKVWKVIDLNNSNQYDLHYKV
jgi:hypothetical protein